MDIDTSVVDATHASGLCKRIRLGRRRAGISKIRKNLCRGTNLAVLNHLFSMIYGWRSRCSLSDRTRRPGRKDSEVGQPIEELAMMTNPSQELMRTISEVLDVREVFPRMSEIANQVLPHDCLELVCRDESEKCRRPT